MNATSDFEKISSASNVHIGYLFLNPEPKKQYQYSVFLNRYHMYNNIFKLYLRYLQYM